MLSRRQKQHSQARNTGWDWLQMLHERKKPQVQPLFDHPHSEETLPQFCECWALGNSLPACVVYWYRSVAFILSRKNKQPYRFAISFWNSSIRQREKGFLSGRHDKCGRGLYLAGWFFTMSYQEIRTPGNIVHTLNGAGSSGSQKAGEMPCEEPGDRREADTCWMWREITQVGRETEKFTNTGQSSEV